MPVTQTRNAEAQMLGSTDHLSIGDRNFPAEWYGAAVSPSYIAAITVPLNTQRFNPAPEIYSFASDTLTILIPGYYVIQFLVASQKTTFSSTEGSFYAWLEEDPATSVFATVPATTVYTAVFSAPAYVYASAIVLAGANYRYRVRTATHGVSFTTIANGSKLSVVRLYQNGSFAPEA